MINKKVCRLMNEQVKHELESFYIYLSMSAYFQTLGLDGMAHWMRAQAHEEMIHGMKFLDHILDRGGEASLLELAKPKTTWSSPKEAWKDTCEHEAFISGKINGLTAAVRQENEFSSEPLLAWFLKEQVEEEANVGKIAQQIALVGEKDGLLLLDRELGARVFVAGSPLDPAAYNLATAT